MLGKKIAKWWLEETLKVPTSTNKDIFPQVNAKAKKLRHDTTEKDIMTNSDI